MPTYEYLCRQCGHRFEAWQKMTDDPLTICPKCGASIHRVLYPAGIVFKGSGFYKTEYGSSSIGKADSSSSDGKGDSAESKSAAETAKKESSKTESSGSASTPAPAAAAD
jgi:putative FmdB family regulatory protein